jgi:GNAT superfamily N-acetyltransferase
VSEPADAQLRGAQERDAAAIAGLLAELGYPASTETIRDRLARVEQDGANCVLVAELAGRVVGLAAFHVIPHLELDEATARLTSLVVAEDARGQGIGRALVERMEAEAREHGCGRIELTSGDQRTEAHAFYRRLGFADRSRRFVKELE